SGCHPPATRRQRCASSTSMASLSAARQSGPIYMRLLATPTRIRRELGAVDATDVHVLRSLWQLHGECLYDGCAVDLRSFPPALRGRAARDALTRLRDAQFLDFAAPWDALYFSQPSRSLESFAIDWPSLARRRAHELDKLDAIQRYVDTRECRRGFVLRYFGERV